MTREFNITGVCVPHLHYMVDISGKIAQIMPMIERGKYFTINRPRQYGKTTLLFEISKAITKNKNFICVNTSFEGLGMDAYENAESFVTQFLELLHDEFHRMGFEKLVEVIDNNANTKSLKQLNVVISELTTGSQKIVVLIDEVDKSLNNQLFLDFLGMLRNKYLNTSIGKDTTFHSVVLSGVHDVKTLKLKLLSNEEKKFNSPWNIASDFTVDMSFSPEEISTMLDDYIQETKIEMDVLAISQRIHYFTSGYPFLVSRICKEIDETDKDWSINGVDIAVKKIITERNTNFESLAKHIQDHPDINQFLESIIIAQKQFQYNALNPTIQLAEVHGIFKNEKGKLAISNKIYEEVISDYITSIYEQKSTENFNVVQSSYLKPDGRLDLEKVLLKFQEVIKEKYSKTDLLKSDEFLEKDLRLLFLVFLKPIINGIGFSFKEVETSEEKRLDIVIIFRDEKFILELKIWRGMEYHKQGTSQLKDYMNREGAGRGFMLIMDKTRHKEFSSETDDEIFMVWV